MFIHMQNAKREGERDRSALTYGINYNTYKGKHTHPRAYFSNSE